MSFFFFSFVRRKPFRSSFRTETRLVFVFRSVRLANQNQPTNTSLPASLATHTPLSLPLSLSLSIPFLTPASSTSESSSSFGYTLSQPHALSPLETIKLLRTNSAEGVEMGTHWNLRREVLALLERGWDWHDVGVKVGAMVGKTKGGKGSGWKEQNWMALVKGLER